MKTISVLAILLLVAFAFPLPLQAHGGKTDKNGCHRQGKNVHCHKSQVGDKPVKKSAKGRCYPPNHPDYRKIEAVKTYASISACLRDR